MLNLKKLFLISSLFIFTTLIFISCKKPEGKGGSATIKGSLIVEDWNVAFTQKNGVYPGYDVDVYIIYGTNTGYGDKIKANYNGEFEFKYLRTGKYKIYVYSKDNTLHSFSGDTAFVRDVTLSSKKQVKVLDAITIYK